MVDKKFFIFGLGFAAQAVARAAMADGFRVAGTCRTQEKCDALKQQGIEAVLFENVTPDMIRGYGYILSSIPPQENGDVVIPLLHRNIKWMGYFSTTGVYGDHKGEWVNEGSFLYPNNKRLLNRLVAEAQWIVRGGEVFRLAGIYGKGRSAIEEVRDGRARRIYKEGQVFSRIHVDDIAQVILAAIEKPSRGAIYNVCDDKPAASHEVVEYACELLDKAVPPMIPFEQADMSVMAREFYSTNRRVINRRIKEELGVKLLYPSYREGLAAVVASY